ncbi:MAG: Ni/Fe hydrogenase subunit gamma, partial [Thiohalophilus sp.]
MNLPFLPYEAQIFQRLEEARDIFTLRLRFTDPAIHDAYSFQPGQFNMLYLYGVGEIPISIVSDPEDEHAYDHTIRSLGRVTRALAELKEGDYIGVRGAFGRGWPMQQAEGKDVVIITGGLGCAPVVSVINYVLNRREKYNRLVIMQGVKHANDLIWRSKYETWSKLP